MLPAELWDNYETGDVMPEWVRAATVSVVRPRVGATTDLLLNDSQIALHRREVSLHGLRLCLGGASNGLGLQAVRSGGLKMDMLRSGVRSGCVEQRLGGCANCVMECAVSMWKGHVSGWLLNLAAWALLRG